MARTGLAGPVRVARWADAVLGPGSDGATADGKATLSDATARRAAADLGLSVAQVRADWDTARLAGLVEVHGDSARPGWRLRAWNRDDSAVLRGWVALFDAWSLASPEPEGHEPAAVAEVVSAMPQVLSFLQLSAGPVPVEQLLDLLQQRVTELRTERCEIPYEPGTDRLAEPGTEPTAPGADRLAEPGTERLAESGTQGPAESGTQGSAARGTGRLAAPGTEPTAPERLAESGTQRSAEPGTQGPAAPGTERPTAPGTGRLAAPGTEPTAPGTQRLVEPVLARATVPAARQPCGTGAVQPDPAGARRPSESGHARPAELAAAAPEHPALTGDTPLEPLLDWALRALASVGALTYGDGQATLTPLGNWAVWVKLEQICVAAQSPAGNIEQSAEDMLRGCAQLRPNAARAEYRAWLAARTVGDAVTELIHAARGEDALLRGLAFEALRVVGAPAEPDVHAVVEEPALRPYALLWLAEHDGIDPEDAHEVLTREEATWLWVDTAAAVADHGESPMLVRHLESAVQPTVPQLLDEVRAVGHPRTVQVLVALAAAHPDPALAKAVRRAAFQVHTGG